MGLANPGSAESHGLLRTSFTTDGVERIYSWRRLYAYRLVVVAGLSIEDALAGYWEDLKACVAIGLGLTAMALLVTGVLDHNRIDNMLSRGVLRAAVDNISQGLMVISADRHVPLLNARAVELLDLPPHLALPGFEFNSLLEWQLEAGEFADNDSAAERTLAELGESSVATPFTAARGAMARCWKSARRCSIPVSRFAPSLTSPNRSTTPAPWPMPAIWRRRRHGPDLNSSPS